MVTEFGMSEKLGPLACGKHEEMVFLGRQMGEQRNYSDDVAKMIDDEVRAIVEHAYQRATEVLTTHQHRLTELAEALVAKETIEADRVRGHVRGPARPAQGGRRFADAEAGHAAGRSGQAQAGAAGQGRGARADTAAGLIGPSPTHPGGRTA